ncbi:hypothetical protein FNF27_04999 [Cafeteria roenbergensis]|uniref:Uncharacterized protein n=1 Tax=Cafeteria roenbergensis TaxID=33653 RepID=A0A5A8CVT6_CAFRO|nr:hypothetical protein FNF29_00624 [Cafeteria roenbergensis]KAA0161934.1 hypothetical protein FNF31_03511 [Cafeteria roenbergensis]KAA0168353.1 hypothetical protein FNF28_02513 [Cafeteria roenbergensis]KAA0173504.1 hypothetical protein FNF27_04999 [Cafeteria roenbergensis]|eukprot:KAA0157272.1 hypothetical protein FNF29_00624 [Cafeteria roenbergensis]
MVNLSAPTMVSSDVGWAIGTSLAVAAQFVGNLGTVLQRRSHIESGSKPVLSRPLWIFGLSLIILASVSDFVALNFTTQSMLGGLGSLTLVANTIFAPLIAWEVLTFTHIWATVLIVIGCSVVVAYGPHSSDLYSPKQLFRLLAAPGFILFSVIMVAAGVALHFSLDGISKKVETRLTDERDRADALARAAARRRQARRRPRRSQPPFVLTESGISLDYSRVDRPWMSYHLHRSGFAVMSAIFGAANVLFGKILSQIMSSAVFSSSTAFYVDTTLSSALSVVALFCIILIVVGAVGQMKYINDATQRFEALLVQPIYQASWTLLSVAGGMVVQREWTLFADVSRASLFFLGILLTVSGAFVLSQVRASSSDSARAHKERSASARGDAAQRLREAGGKGTTDGAALRGGGEGSEADDGSPMLDGHERHKARPESGRALCDRLDAACAVDMDEDDEEGIVLLDNSSLAGSRRSGTGSTS